MNGDITTQNLIEIKNNLYHQKMLITRGGKNEIKTIYVVWLNNLKYGMQKKDWKKIWQNIAVHCVLVA